MNSLDENEGPNVRDSSENINTKNAYPNPERNRYENFLYDHNCSS